jgi:hypothetical protein
MMTIRAMALAAANWGKLLCLETRQSAYAATMATAARVAFLVSSSNLISIAGGDGGLKEDNLAMKKSTIDGNQ